MKDKLKHLLAYAVFLHVKLKHSVVIRTIDILVIQRSVFLHVNKADDNFQANSFWI